jgi:hypothetical protein
MEDRAWRMATKTRLLALGGVEQRDAYCVLQNGENGCAWGSLVRFCSPPLAWRGRGGGGTEDYSRLVRGRVGWAHAGGGHGIEIDFSGGFNRVPVHNTP